MERVTGIEPAFSAWKAETLAIVLHPHGAGLSSSASRRRAVRACYLHAVLTWLPRDSNPGPTGFHPDALPTELGSHGRDGTNRTSATWSQARRDAISLHPVAVPEVAGTSRSGHLHTSAARLRLGVLAMRLALPREDGGSGWRYSKPRPPGPQPDALGQTELQPDAVLPRLPGRRVPGLAVARAWYCAHPPGTNLR